jgi:signal transduction histidine kinase
VPKIGRVSNSKAVTKDTIWQQITAKSGPLSGAALFACLLSLITVWFTADAIGPWICAGAFLLLLPALAFASVNLSRLLVPILLGSAAFGLMMSAGGFSSPAILACLWPVLGCAVTRQGLPDPKRLFIGVAAGLAAGVTGGLVAPRLSAFGSDIAAPQIAILAVGVCAALICAVVVSLKSAFGQLAGATALVSDTRELLQERDAALNEAEIARTQTRDRAQFMAEMSHEIRTPLNAILGFADTMREAVFGPIPKAYNDYPDLIHKSGAHLLDLLDLSKIEAGRYDLAIKPQRLDEIVAESVRLSSGGARAAGIQIRHEASGAVMVQADGRAIRQAIFNLMSNAIKFTPKDGRILVRIKSDAAAGTAAIEVEDNGIGISAADLARIGEPWNQVSDAQSPDAKRPRGSGLGLALVKRLTELQGGNLTLTSTLGTGTLARVTLPLAPPQSVMPPA